jgi:S-adenosylmethionine:tRNA ribosyltransferase-isomerase
MHAAEPSIAFTLPPELEATEPPEARGIARDEVRMLVTRREDDSVEHARFRDLPRFLDPGDLVVVNASGTMAAALRATRRGGEAIDFHLSTQLPAGLWVVEPRKVQVAAGEVLDLPEGALATMLAPYRRSARLWIAQLELTRALDDYLHLHGRPIRYPYVRAEWPLSAYQTVYANRPGSAEMPSAGRPFTAELLTRLHATGVRIEPIVLHTGVASLEGDEQPYEEYYEVSAGTADAIRETRRTGGRVVAVGTTVVRALESSVDERGEAIASRGWTDLVITPEHSIRVVDGLLTGFHEPRATHLAMLQAIAGQQHIALAYREALRARYLWHEFGDVHLVL